MTTINNKIKEQSKIILTFLEALYFKTLNDYTEFSLNNMAINYGVSTSILGVIKEFNILLVKKEGSKHFYKSADNFIPNDDLALKMLMALKEKQRSYNLKSTADKKIFSKSYTKEKPIKLKIGTKIYSKVIAKKPIKVIKEALNTPSEIIMNDLLNKIKKDLSHENSHILNFSDYCIINHIPEKTEYALRILNCVIKVYKGGIKWNKDVNIDLKLIKSIFEKRQEFNDAMPDILQEKMSEHKWSMTKDQKYLIKISTYYTFLCKLQEMCLNKTPFNLEDFVKTHKIYNTFFGYNKIYNIVTKNGNTYIWNFKIVPNIENAKDVYTWCLNKKAEYANKQVSKEDVISDIEKKNIEKLVESTIKNENTHDQSIGRQVRTEFKPINIVDISLENNDKNIKSILAEKFAKAGNYKMAEQLLDEILN